MPSDSSKYKTALFKNYVGYFTQYVNVDSIELIEYVYDCKFIKFK